VNGGYRNVYCGLATVYHHESRTSRRIDRKMEGFKKNHSVFIHRWHDFVKDRPHIGKAISIQDAVMDYAGGGIGKTRFSIILTSFNRTTYLADAIESVIRQTFSDWELIIADDNSNVDTLNVIKRYTSGKHGDRIRLIRSSITDEQRRGTVRYSVMINAALGIASGEIICYLTDDAIYFSRKLEVLDKVYKRPGVNAAYNMQRRAFVNGSGHEFTNNKEIRDSYGVVTVPATLIDHNSFSHTSEIAEGLLWETDPSYWACADGIFQMLIAMRTRIVPIPNVLDEHKYHTHNVAWSYRGKDEYKKASSLATRQGPPFKRNKPLAEVETMLWLEN